MSSAIITNRLRLETLLRAIIDNSLGYPIVQGIEEDIGGGRHCPPDSRLRVISHFCLQHKHHNREAWEIPVDQISRPIILAAVLRAKLLVAQGSVELDDIEVAETPEETDLPEDWDLVI